MAQSGTPLYGVGNSAPEKSTRQLFTGSGRPSHQMQAAGPSFKLQASIE